MDNINTTERLLSGITKATNVIRSTYGSAGGNVILEEELYPQHSVRNDGKAIMDRIKLSDPVENIGVNILKEAGDKAEGESGDGRKTTMLLTEAILKEAQNIEAQPMDIKRSLDECLPIITAAIDAQKKEITVNDVKNVATIASENEQIGTLLQEIYEQIGKEGIVEIDSSGLPETFYEITEGVRIRAGWFGEYSQTEEGKATYKNPKILISKDKIVSVDQLEEALKILTQNSINELVIYCEDIDISVASRLAITHMRGGFKTLIIKAPVLWKDWIYEDLAKMTGATPVDSKEGKTFKTLSLQDLGTCDKIIATKDETRIIGIKDISEHIESIKDNQLRVSWLQTKVAVLKVGAISESELSYIIKKAKDACSASYFALKDGVVEGGGVAFLNCIAELPDTIGGKILTHALVTPHDQILANFGVDTMNIPDNVVDASWVVKNAIKNAISIAGTILTAKSVIILPKEDKK